MDYYRILNVNRNATQEEIKKAHRRLSGKYHPDNAGERAREQFDKVQEAYDILGDAEKRAAYDSKLRDGENSRRADCSRAKSGAKNFYAGGSGQAKKHTAPAGPINLNTDELFQSFFKYK